jgi:ribosomal protein S18 acetylase RimI-like enzyme
MTVDALRIEDYEAAHALWRLTEGMGLSSADTLPAIRRYLERNPGMSTAARIDGRLVATALAGHDGRRGYLHHVAVDPAHRGCGLGRAVVDRSLAMLKEAGMDRCHLFIFASNSNGQAFWRSVGWTQRRDIRLYSRGLTPDGALPPPGQTQGR